MSVMRALMPARSALQAAELDVAKGDYEGAAAHLRERLARRLRAAYPTLVGPDARSAELLAASALERRDLTELHAVAEAILLGAHPSTERARAFITWCEDVAAGDVRRAVDEIPTLPLAEGFVPRALVLAAERSFGRDLDDFTLGAVAGKLPEGADDLRGRLAVVHAVVALRQGDEAAASRRVADLPAGATAASRAAAALIADRLGAAVGPLAEVPAPDRGIVEEAAAACAAIRGREWASAARKALGTVTTPAIAASLDAYIGGASVDVLRTVAAASDRTREQRPVGAAPEAPAAGLLTRLRAGFNAPVVGGSFDTSGMSAADQEFIRAQSARMRARDRKALIANLVGLAFIALGVLGPSIAVSWVAGEPYVFLTIRPILGGVLLAIFAYRGLHPDYR